MALNPPPGPPVAVPVGQNAQVLLPPAEFVDVTFTLRNAVTLQRLPNLPVTWGTDTTPLAQATLFTSGADGTVLLPLQIGTGYSIAANIGVGFSQAYPGLTTFINSVTPTQPNQDIFLEPVVPPVENALLIVRDAVTLSRVPNCFLTSNSAGAPLDGTTDALGEVIFELQIGVEYVFSVNPYGSEAELFDYLSISTQKVTIVPTPN